MSLVDDVRGALRSFVPTTPRDGSRRHRVSITIGDQRIGGWSDYEILCSMVEPADGFRLQRPFDRDAWRLCELDQKVKVAIDDVVMLDGFIDDRAKRAADGVMEISGRDKSGRLVQESIPDVTGWDGLSLVDAIKKLAAPWYTNVTLSDARNRNVRRGKGHRAAAAGEPDAFFTVKGKLDEDHAGRLDPGETRWQVIEQLVSSSGILCWSSADGRELVIGQPNYKQAAQYVFRHSRTRGSTVTDMRLDESVRDGYAMIEVHGAGAGDDDNYGDNVSTYLGIARDGENKDGTGNDFKFPKRLVVSQNAQQSNGEAQRAADREMRRRKFKRRHLTVSAPLHGQLVGGTIMTLFAPNTLARVIDDDLDVDDIWLPYACNFRGSRSAGETTELMLVPRFTEFTA